LYSFQGEVKENDNLETGVISLVQDENENIDTEKGNPKNKSVIVIENQPNTLINYTNGRSSPIVIDKNPQPPDDMIDQGYQNGNVLETVETKPDELSDTDSGVESEKKIVIGELDPPDSQPCDRESVDDSDSDSWGPPTPEKGRHVEATNMGMVWCEYLYTNINIILI
jgi:hypothetical protein